MIGIATFGTRQTTSWEIAHIYTIPNDIRTIRDRLQLARILRCRERTNRWLSKSRASADYKACFILWNSRGLTCIWEVDSNWDSGFYTYTEINKYQLSFLVCLMENILRSLQWQECLVYKVDKIVPRQSYSESLLKAWTHISASLISKLRLKPSKCILFQKEIKFWSWQNQWNIRLDFCWLVSLLAPWQQQFSSALSREIVVVLVDNKLNIVLLTSK